jgi:hypothetical protein
MYKTMSRHKVPEKDKGHTGSAPVLWSGNQGHHGAAGKEKI